MMCEYCKRHIEEGTEQNVSYISYYYTCDLDKEKEEYPRDCDSHDQKCCDDYKRHKKLEEIEKL